MPSQIKNINAKPESHLHMYIVLMKPMSQILLQKHDNSEITEIFQTLLQYFLERPQDT